MNETRLHELLHALDVAREKARRLLAELGVARREYESAIQQAEDFLKEQKRDGST